MQALALDGEEESYLRKNFSLIHSRTSENAPLSNKIEVILIIEPTTEKKKLSPTSFHPHLKIWCINL